MRRFFYLCGFFVFLGLFITETGHAEIQANLESPAADQGVSGISAISGWAYSSVPGAHVTIQLSIDGTDSGTIPCCSQRNDVNPQIPSGFALLFNFNLLSEGAHTIAVKVTDDQGSEQTQVHAITVAKPGGFEVLSDLTLSNTKVSLSDDKQEIIVDGAEVQDKATEKTQKVNLQLAWQENAQRIGIVEAANVGNPSGGNDGGGDSGGTTCEDTNSCVPPTGIQLTLENPPGNSLGSSRTTVSGISVVSGWTFSPTLGAAIDSIRLRLDSKLVGEIPCCSDRQDVKAAFAGQSEELQQQAEQSGFGSLLNFNLLDSGAHTLSVEVEDSTGATSTIDSSIQTVRLADSEFLNKFDLSGAKASVIEGEILFLEDVTVRDKDSQQEEQITVGFLWEPNCQCFVAQEGCGNGTVETGEECDVNALDGQSCTSLGFSGGSLSCRPRCGTDDNDCFLPCAFELKNCTGSHLIYVTNGNPDPDRNGNTVSVINPAADQDENPIVATIKVGRGPRGIAVSPDGSRVYVCNFNDNTLSVISTETNTVTDTIKSVGDGPWAVAVTPDGTKIYVVNAFDDSVSVLNAATKEIQAHIPVGSNPQDIALAPDGKQGYVTNYGGNSVWVIDLSTDQVVKKVLVGKGPDGVAVSPDNTKVYVVNYGTNDVDGNSVTVLDRASNEVTGTVQVDLQPTKVAFSPDSSKAYVSNSVSGTITVINTSDRSIADTIPVGGDPPTQPEGLVVTAGGFRLYVVLFGRGSGRDFLEISTGTSSVLQDIRVGEGPFGIAVAPAAKP